MLSWSSYKSLLDWFLAYPRTLAAVDASLLKLYFGDRVRNDLHLGVRFRIASPILHT
jgi:hypothetical protein